METEAGRLERHRAFDASHAAMKRDAAARSMHGVFELAAFYGLILGMSVTAAALVLRVASWLALPVAEKAGVATLAAVTLAVVFAIIWHLIGPKGGRSAVTLKAWARTYAYPMTLAVGLYAGWQWRHHNHPQADRQQAYEIAAKECGQIPFCLLRAERTAAGADLAQYIKPKPNAPR